MGLVVKASPDVRYIFKGWPIFASRWENSGKAAQRGIDGWKQKGVAAYAVYHNGVYRTGHNEGQLTAADIDAAAKAAGVTGKLAADYTLLLEKNDQLAQTLGLTGTPGLIVMPVNNATPKTITVFPGAATAEQIEVAIRKASN